MTGLPTEVTSPRPSIVLRSNPNSCKRSNWELDKDDISDAETGNGTGFAYMLDLGHAQGVSGTQQ